MRLRDRAAASRYAAKLGGIYGDRAFLSLEIHHPDDEPLSREIAALGNPFGLPIVAAQPVYCLTPDEAVRLPLMAAMDRNCLLAEILATSHWPLAVSAEMPAANGQPPAAHTQYSVLSTQHSFHWLTPAELQARFHHLPEALSNIDAIIQQCQPALPDGRPIWPVLDLPEAQTPEQALVAKTNAGLEKKVNVVVAAGVPALELDYELDALGRSGRRHAE